MSHVTGMKTLTLLKVFHVSLTSNRRPKGRLSEGAPVREELVKWRGLS